MEWPTRMTGPVPRCSSNAWMSSAYRLMKTGPAEALLSPNPRRSGAITRYFGMKASTCLDQAPRLRGKPWMKTRGRPSPASVKAIWTPLVIAIMGYLPGVHASPWGASGSMLQGDEHAHGRQEHDDGRRPAEVPEPPGNQSEAPHDFGIAHHEHHDDHDRPGHDAVHDGAEKQGLDGRHVEQVLEGGEIEGQADDRGGAQHGVEALGIQGLAVQSRGPFQRLADGVGGRARQDRHGQEARAGPG